MEKETWKDVFCKQLDTLTFWAKLFGEESQPHLYLNREDAIYICKKAQADTYSDILEHLRGKVDPTVISEIEAKVDELWKKDDSGLGLFINGKQITE